MRYAVKEVERFKNAGHRLGDVDAAVLAGEAIELAKVGPGGAEAYWGFGNYLLRVAQYAMAPRLTYVAAVVAFTAARLAEEMQGRPKGGGGDEAQSG
ncbi:hypothetical protein [Oceanithermus sp.]|uniref:hypothetical protein n=1 Tax=Oceanithermus sp. TaxID=2268145 RepID=UPI0025EA8D6E|nr:hypothetical protein [Oceanithermus sp.]